MKTDEILLDFTAVLQQLSKRTKHTPTTRTCRGLRGLTRRAPKRTAAPIDGANRFGHVGTYHPRIQRRSGGKNPVAPTWLNARRRTIVVFSKDPNTQKVARVALTRYAFGKHFPSVWNKEEQPDQWQALADYIVAKNPKKIGINTSDYFGIADGLATTDYQGMYNALPKKYQKRLTSAEALAVAWIETRTEKEMILFQQLTEITHNIIAEAFSTQVITPGGNHHRRCGVVAA